MQAFAESQPRLPPKAVRQRSEALPVRHEAAEQLLKALRSELQNGGHWTDGAGHSNPTQDNDRFSRIGHHGDPGAARVDDKAREQVARSIGMTSSVARIHRATDERGKLIREHTKTGTVPVFRIEPTLRPLLNAMAIDNEGLRATASDSRRAGVLRAWSFSGIIEGAAELRRHLCARTSRARHCTSHSDVPALALHDLRAIRTTWAAICADATIEIRDRAGHADIEQTNDHMRRAAGVANVGNAFPTLDARWANCPSDGHKKTKRQQGCRFVSAKGGT